MPSTRRDFIQNTFAVMAAGSALPFLFPRSVFAQAAAGGDAPKNRRLVIVQLAGGNDGLNTVIPFRNGTYTKARPSLRYGSNEALPLGTTGLALHPAMRALRDLYDTGRLAVIQGVGYPSPNRSHFESMDIWQTADPKLSRYIGWAGRLLDEIHDRQGGLAQGVALSDELPLSLIAEKALVQTMEDPEKYQIQVEDRLKTEKSALLAAYRNLYSAETRETEGRRYVRETGGETYTGTVGFQSAIRRYQPKATYPGGGLGPQLQDVARMLIGGAPGQVYHASLNGFDTHASQRGTHGNLMSNLSESLAAFYLDLRAHDRHEDVTVVTFSEFGRRVFQNGSDGTDHGAASVMFVLGGLVRGGMYGNYPSLTDLDDGDLKHNVDFRSVYATLIDNWMGADADVALGGAFPRLGFLG